VSWDRARTKRGLSYLCAIWLRGPTILAGHCVVVGASEPINKKMGLVKNGPSYTKPGHARLFLMNHTEQDRRILDERRQSEICNSTSIAITATNAGGKRVTWPKAA